ncbi:hypothetical protein DICVIV_03929 [Dictyocaulus viviparus]|uniref:UBA domain-containing protein n=1 Tax=Dictyocaulus viviparus TaxID=29172 RepID=A0A0D8XZK3_DICVI|nr:hypothetical protein DICVIV_03929 [Dictyocaulus viviparus]
MLARRIFQSKSLRFRRIAPDPEVLYASQLEQLAGMGFSNRAQNIAGKINVQYIYQIAHNNGDNVTSTIIALRASFGDLNAAVERLLNSP